MHNKIAIFSPREKYFFSSLINFMFSRAFLVGLGKLLHLKYIKYFIAQTSPSEITYKYEGDPHVSQYYILLKHLTLLQPLQNKIPL